MAGRCAKAADEKSNLRNQTKNNFRRAAELFTASCLRANRTARRDAVNNIGQAINLIQLLRRPMTIHRCHERRYDARVLQVLQISQFVAPLLHPNSLIINVCSTVAGGWGSRIPVTSAVRHAAALRLAAPIWCQRRSSMKLYSTENSEEPRVTG